MPSGGKTINMRKLSAGHFKVLSGLEFDISSFIIAINAHNMYMHPVVIVSL
jgi:hypothetical protein